MASFDKLKTDALMDQMKLHMDTDAGKQLKIGFNEKSYVVDLKKGEVKEGKYEDGKPDATFSFTDDDFIKIAMGKMNSQIAFMRGAMKIKGSISTAQKFTPDIFPSHQRLLTTEQDALEQRNNLHKVKETKVVADRSEGLAVLKHQRAQRLMENADLATYKAVVALKIYEAAQFAESSDTIASFFHD